MQERFNAGLLKNGLRFNEHTLLLCVSGGVDSVVLAELVFNSGFRFGIAHVNYGLRGMESDEDEQLVNEIAKKYACTFHILHGNEKLHPLNKGESVQMWARRIRHQWFDKLRMENDYSFSATAHHTDDEIETFFINLGRKAGGRGLSGYEYRKGNSIKPLLEFTREEIECYARERGLSWREDSSNKKDIYLRNKIRHQVIPAIRKVFPAFTQSMHEAFMRLKRERLLLDFLLKEQAEKLISPTKQGFELNSRLLLEYPDPAMMLFELIREFGFNLEDAGSICENLTDAHGQRYFAKEWSILLYRDKLLIVNNLAKYNPCEPELFMQELDAMPVFAGGIPKSSAYFDWSKLDGDLYLKRWQKGDYFYPTGMTGRKKISDLFNELGIAAEDKPKQYLLMCRGEVVWVVNHRIDRRFAADAQSQKVLCVSLKS